MKVPSESGSVCRLEHSDLRLWRPLRFSTESVNIYRMKQPLRSSLWKPIKFPAESVSDSRVEHP